MQVNRMRVFHMEKPLGIDRIPYFSWTIESNQTDTYQISYRLRIFTENGNAVWDSGVTCTRKNTYVTCEGMRLQSCTRYVWKVDVTDNHGETASKTDWFETAFLEQIQWRAKWIKSEDVNQVRQAGFGNQPPATLFRKEFFMGAKPVRARLYMTAHGVYEFTLNGKKCSFETLMPGYSSYDSILYYQSYDITSLLQEGENILQIYVGDGWYFSSQTTMHQDTAGQPHAVLFQLQIDSEDGKKEIICSDGTECYGTGPILFSDIFAGERYDARRKIVNWKPVRLGGEDYSNLQSGFADQIIAVEERKTERLFVTPQGDTVLDFGQNMAGRVRCHVNLPEGTVLSLEHFEVLDENGNYFNTILQTTGVGGGADQKAEFISAGKEEIYEPHFTFFGFRYVRVRVFDASGLVLKRDRMPRINPDDFTAVALSSKKENLGYFACSDPDVTKLYSNIRWSQRSNMISIPTDCPQREKAGWTADAAIYAGTALLNEDVTPFFERWLDCLTADQQKNGLVPIVVPFNQTYQNMSVMLGKRSNGKGPATSAGWGDAAVKLPWTMYQITGNQEVLKKQYDSMKNWCDYVICTAKNECGRPELPPEKEQYLWDSGFHFGEWVIPSTSAEGFGANRAAAEAMHMTVRYTAPVYGYGSVQTFSKIAELLGETEDYKYYSFMADKMKDAITTCLIGMNGEAPAEYMGAYVLLLYFDLVPEAYRKSYADHLVKMIEQNDGCLDTGFLATPYLLDVLMETGYESTAWNLLFQQKSPSWLYEVKKGATTIWETWNAVREDGVPQHVSMNHYSFGCVAEWMYRNIGGVICDEPGFTHFVVYPRACRVLDGAQYRYISEQGEIRTDWRKRNGELYIEVTIPCNSSATVILPDDSKYEIGSGTYQFQCKL